MDIKSTFIIFVVSVGIFAAALAYNFSLYLSSRHTLREVFSVERNTTAGKNQAAGTAGEAKNTNGILSLTNLFSPQSGMDIPGKWRDKAAAPIEVSGVSSEFRLSGTIFSDQEDLKRAVFFFTQTKEDKVFREGDYIDESTKLQEVRRNSVIVTLNGKRVALAVIPEEKVGAKTEPAARSTARSRSARQPAQRAGEPDLKVSKIDDFTFAVDESSVDYLTENINKVITQVRIIPYFESGEAAGFRFAAIRPGSVFSELGFTSGDVIKQINGVPLTSPEKIYTIFQNLKDEKRIEVDILRRGQKKTVGYEIR